MTSLAIPTTASLRIGAVAVDVSDRDVSETRNPARHHQVVTVFPRATAEDVDAAVGAAAEAQRTWAARSALDRGDVLYTAAHVLDSETERLAALVCAEVGKTIGEARAEVRRGVDVLRYFAGACAQPHGWQLPSRRPDVTLSTTREPVGVVAVITPWNFPAAIPLWKIAPAIGFGNSVVWKPASQAVGVAAALCDALIAGGVPAGVLNLVAGDGSTVGNVLVDHASIDAITFTGSTSVGRAIERRVAGRGVTVQVELGGNNPTIVMADAPIERAVDIVVNAAMGYAGQKCTATSRAIVEAAAFDQVLERLVDRIERLRLGDPADPRTEVGPVIDGRAANEIVDAVAAARDRGATVRCGGELVEYLPDGAYVAPTVVTDLSAADDLAQEETFGPVLTVHPAANGVRFGLSAAICTADIGAATRFVREVHAGVVKVNAETTGLEPQAPFGGVKASGSHLREQGPSAVEFYTRVRTVYFGDV
jgi:aldehyde dehydrogenase (NAD+)